MLLLKRKKNEKREEKEECQRRIKKIRTKMDFKSLLSLFIIIFKGAYEKIEIKL